MKTPWSERAAALRGKEGPYADFAAWLEWANQDGDFAAATSDIETIDMLAIYHRMAKAVCVALEFSEEVSE